MSEKAKEAKQQAIYQAHDKVFKLSFSNHEAALGLLQAHLPKALLQHLDLSKLERMPDSFVSADFKNSHSDLVYQTEFKQKPFLLSLILEHQSTPDSLMPLRLLEYKGAYWSQLKRANPLIKKLPPILPIVISQCKKPWNSPLVFEDLLDIPHGQAKELLKPYISNFEYLLIDLNQYDENRLMGNLLSHIACSFMKAASIGGILPAWEQLRSFLKEVRNPEYLGLLDAWMRYTLSVTGKEVGQEKVFKIFKENLNPEAREQVMTLAEELREEGEARGIARGIAKGRAEGLQQTLLKMILKRFGQDKELIQGVQAAQDIAVLEDLIDTFLESADRETFKSKLQI